MAAIAATPQFQMNHYQQLILEVREVEVTMMAVAAPGHTPDALHHQYHHPILILHPVTEKIMIVTIINIPAVILKKSILLMIPTANI